MITVNSAGELLFFFIYLISSIDLWREAAPQKCDAKLTAVTNACIAQASTVLVVATGLLGFTGLSGFDDQSSISDSVHLKPMILFIGFSVALTLWSLAHLPRISAKQLPSSSAMISVPLFFAVLAILFSLERFATMVAVGDLA